MFRHLKENCYLLVQHRLYSINAHLKLKPSSSHNRNRRVPHEHENENHRLMQVLKSREEQLRHNTSNTLPLKTTQNITPVENNIEHLSQELLPQNQNEDNLRIIQSLNKMIKKLDHLNDEIKEPSLKKIDKTTETFNQEILAYVDACLNDPKLIKEALELIKILSIKQTPDNNKTRIKYKRLINIEIYNKILIHLAKQKRLNDIGFWFKMMRTNGIQPNVHSYAACLLAVTHNNPKSKLTVARILNDISNANLNLNELNSMQMYSKTQLNEITQTIRLVIPEFELNTSGDDKCTNELLISLGKDDHVKSIFDRELPLNINDLHENFEKQLQMEQKSSVEVPSIYEFAKKLTPEREKLKEELNLLFRNQIFKGLEAKIQMLDDSRKINDSYIYPIIKSIPTQLLADLLEQELHKLFLSSQYHSENLNFLSIALGQQCEVAFNLYRFKKNGGIDKIKQVHGEYLNEVFEISKNKSETINHRKLWLAIAKENELNLEDLSTKWASRTKLKLGKFLYDVLFDSLKFNINRFSVYQNNKYITNEKWVNVLYRIYRVEGIYKDLEIKIAPLISRLYTSSVNSFKFSSFHLPMLSIPVPWCTPKIGGYLLSLSNLLRVDCTNHEMSEQYTLIQNSKPNELYPIYDSLNILASCPWKINTRILDLMIGIFNRNGSKHLNIPQPESEGPELPQLDMREKLPKSEYIKKVKARQEARKVRAEMYSLWCTELYKLSIANLYRNQILWFPHSLDFRGRSYPVPPYFNHLGNDLSRSLMLFAELKPLGTKGLDTLKLHCINLTGTMKRSSIKERIEYANAIIDDILDSAEKPLDGRLWWQKSEEPWQTLACCIEISNAIKSSNPHEYKSGFAIHQDGSCNGLQHYAALGRDELGASSVNLAKSELPRDVYSDVVDRVEKERKKDAELNSIEIAKTLEGLVKRKVIKQTVMTTVYNVTSYGAKLQIQRQLVDLPLFENDKLKLEEAGKYLTDKTFKCLGQMFNSASNIQKWFSQCAYYISRVRNTSIQWKTPLGLPVVQPYFKQDEKTKLQRPNYNKQRAAFPPNFVHSLDSCHMMLTALYCEHAKLRFASVHDCYWTHACDVDLMNRICRQQFIALHNLPILEDLSQSFSVYKFSQQEIDVQENKEVIKAMEKFNKILDDVPIKGKFDLRNVLDSIYFFS